MNCDVCDKNRPLRAFELDSGWILFFGIVTLDLCGVFSRAELEPRASTSFFTLDANYSQISIGEFEFGERRQTFLEDPGNFPS